MKTELLFKFRTLFEEERRCISNKLNLDRDSFQIQNEDLLDSSDFISRQLETSVQLHLRNREVLYLKKIDQALRRIADGTFGDCQECGLEISVGRLEARPTALFCIDCKEIQEFEEKQCADDSHSRNNGRALRLA
jgi:DnaK suppressor protein